MNDLRSRRTEAYRALGIFRASTRLATKHGIKSPSEQLAAVALFLERTLGRTRDLAFLGGMSTEVEAQMGELLDAAVRDEGRHLDQYLRPLNELSTAVEPFLDWDPYRDFAELLNLCCGEAYIRASGRLRENLRLSQMQVSDLATQFVSDDLPSAVRTFDLRRGRGAEVTWLERVFYRHALKVTLADTAARRHLAEFSPPAGVEEAVEQAELLVELPSVLEELPEPERRGLELYFGIPEGKEATLTEVAAALGYSSSPEYHARATVLRGLMHLAARLGAQGRLDDEEFQLLQASLQEGRDVAWAARHLGLSPGQAHAALGRVQKKLARALRSRTSSRRKSAGPREGAQAGEEMEESMPTSPVLSPEVRDHLLVALRDLRHAPELRVHDNGQWYVSLGGAWHPLASVREILRDEPSLMKELQERTFPLDWLVLPDAPQRPARGREGADVDPFADVEQRAFLVAQSLAVQLTEAARKKRFRLFGEDLEPTSERVLAVLGGVSQAIEDKLPRRQRRLVGATFRIDRSDTRTSGTWEGTDGDPLDLNALFIHLGALLGQFEDAAAAELAQVAFQALFESRTPVLPGFGVPSIDRDTARLAWQGKTTGTQGPLDRADEWRRQ